VTPDEVGEIEELAVATVLNGEVRRENVVSNMAFSPWFLLSFHSKVMTLLPPNRTNLQRLEGSLLRHVGRGAGGRVGAGLAVGRSYPARLTGYRIGVFESTLCFYQGARIYSPNCREEVFSEIASEFLYEGVSKCLLLRCATGAKGHLAPVLLDKDS